MTKPLQLEGSAAKHRGAIFHITNYLKLSGTAIGIGAGLPTGFGTGAL